MLLKIENSTATNNAFPVGIKSNFNFGITPKLRHDVVLWKAKFLWNGQFNKADTFLGVFFIDIPLNIQVQARRQPRSQSLLPENKKVLNALIVNDTYEPVYI